MKKTKKKNPHGHTTPQNIKIKKETNERTRITMSEICSLKRESSFIHFLILDLVSLTLF